MKNENIVGTLAVIALFLSICAVGILYLQTDDVEVDVSGIASNQALIASLVTAINNVEDDVSNINLPSIEVDSDDLEELEDDLNDDINDLEDDIEDLQDDLSNLEVGEVEDCYQNSGDWSDFKECLYPL